MRPFPEKTGSPSVSVSEAPAAPHRLLTVLGLWYLGAILPVRYGSDLTTLTTNRAPGQGAGEMWPWRRLPPGTEA